MSLVNSQQDLLGNLSDLEARLTKLERQTAVPRLGYSFVATKETTTSTSAVALATADTISLNTTTRTLISFYVRFTVENSGANVNTAFIRDETAAVNYQISSTPGTGPFTLVTVPGSSTGQIVSSGIPFGGYVNLYVTTAGTNVFSLRYSVSAGTGSFSNRLLLAQAQPF